MGIGSMIVLIAIIMASSVGAGLLLNTAFLVQEQADTTGDAAVNNVGTVFIVQDALGDRGAAQDGDILDLHLKLLLAAGSADIAMRNVIIEVTTSTAEFNLVFDAQSSYQHDWDDQDLADTAALAAQADATAFTYTAMEIRDPDDTFYETSANEDDEPNYVVSQGGLIRVFIDLTGATVGTQETITVKIIPKHGVPTLFTGTTEESFSDRYVKF